MKSLLPKIFLSLTLFFVSFSPTLAAVDPDLETNIHNWSLKFVFLSAAVIALVVATTYLFKNLEEKLKTLLFALIVVSSLFTTVYLIGSTLYLNSVSTSGGPVHYHADFEIYSCGEKLDLVDPTGFSNKIGTATLHEHNDGRVHLEGVILEPEDVNFGNFIRVIGGSLTTDKLEIPTTVGRKVLESGSMCPDGSEAELQAFLYTVEGQNIIRRKIYDLPKYILSPEGSVPPGDCIIIELAKNKSRTDQICDSYELQLLKGKFNFGN